MILVHGTIVLPCYSRWIHYLFKNYRLIRKSKTIFYKFHVNVSCSFKRKVYHLIIIKYLSLYCIIRFLYGFLLTIILQPVFDCQLLIKYINIHSSFNINILLQMFNFIVFNLNKKKYQQFFILNSRILNHRTYLL